jgi:hypothetical protein
MSMPPTSRIEEVDGVPTPDLDTFLRVVKSKASSEAVRVKFRSMQDKVSMSTVKHVLEYFPTAELVLKDGRWERIDHPHKDQHSSPTELDAFNLAQEDSMKVS